MRVFTDSTRAWATNQLGPRDPHKDSGWGTSTGIEGYQLYRSTRIVCKPTAGELTAGNGRMTIAPMSR
ncbi:hypothetical protein [Dactylosporangium sp. NPDC051484]|uniref:hypothetical protein n=1 Tax=Dactylosporangium sp. NPDC051484 TaxID=3154942 RepID=UPI00344B55E3